jgi:sugar phosphate permease
MRVAQIATPDRVLVLICAMYLILYVDRVNVATAAGAIKADLHLTNTQLGLVFSAFAYPYAIIQLFGGWFGDRLGPRLALAVGGIVFALATIWTGFVGGLVGLVVARIVVGIGEGPGFSTATRAMTIWLPKARWGFAQGITHAAARVGNAVSPPLVAALIGWLTWRGAFFALGALTLAWVAVWFAYFRDNPANHLGIAPQDLAGLQPPVRRGAQQDVPVWQLLGRMLPVTLVDFCYGWTIWVFLTWLPSFFLSSYGYNLKNSALFAGGILCAGIVGDTVGGIASDAILRRTGSLVRARRDLVIAGMLGALVFLIPVLLFKNIVIVSIALTLAFFCLEIVIGPLWSMPMDIAPRYAGTAGGFMNFGFGIAGILSPLAFGYVIDKTGNWHLPFAISIALLMLGVALTFWTHPDRPFAESPFAEQPSAI